MKRWCFLILLVLFFMPFVSAKAICSDGNSSVMDIKGIEAGDVGTIMGIKIGVINSDDISVFNRYTADVFIDSGKASVSNGTSKEILLGAGNYNVSFVSSTDEKAKVKIGGDEGFVDLEDYATIGSLNVYLLSVEGPSGNDLGNAVVLIGVSKISFSNDQNPSEIVTVGGKKYLIELFSASDTEALFSVSYCGSGEVQEEADVVAANETNVVNQTATNETENNVAEEAQNSSEPQISVEEARRRAAELELGINITEKNASSLGGKFGNALGSGWTWIGFLGVVVIAIFIYFLIRLYRKEK